MTENTAERRPALAPHTRLSTSTSSISCRAYISGDALPGQLQQTGWSQLATPEQSTLNHAAAVFEALARTTLPQPDIVPTPEGGVQLEWHTARFDMEVDVTSPSEVDVFLFDVQRGRRFDFTDLRSLADLRPVAKKLHAMI